MPDPQKRKKILIASSALDKSVWSPVNKHLRKDGYDTIVYQADKVARGEDALEISILSDRTELLYNNNPLQFDSIAAAWYRRPNMFVFLEENAARQQVLFREINALQQPLWSEIPDRTWLNAPSNIAYAERKITQLRLAKKIGFRIPDTLISNTWEPILSKLPKNIIVKSSYGTIGGGSGTRVIFTKAFLNTPQALPLKQNPFPAIWQQQIADKAREWRITVVGDEVFSAAIYTDASAKDDWRKHQKTPAVRFGHGTFPAKLQSKCRQFLKACNLRFGAFDFIEDSQGTITFLECNPNGQYAWLEDELNLPISKAIANSLERIANSHQS